MIDQLLSIGEALVPGFIASMCASIVDSKLPAFNMAGIAETANFMRGWDTIQHIESKWDPALTGAISFGGRSSTDIDLHDFALPVVNDGKGLIVETGPGASVWFPGGRVLHGTVFQLPTRDELSPVGYNNNDSGSDSDSDSDADIIDLVANGVIGHGNESEQDADRYPADWEGRDWYRHVSSEPQAIAEETL